MILIESSTTEKIKAMKITQKTRIRFSKSIFVTGVKALETLNTYVESQVQSKKTWLF